MKKNNVMMTILIITIITILTGCKPSPKQEIVVNKNSVKEISQSSASNTNEKNFEDENDVITWKTNFRTKGNANVNVDAKISIPKADGFLTVKVKSNGFSDEKIQKAISELTENKPIYEAVKNNHTKESIEKQIVNTKQIIAKYDAEDTWSIQDSERYIKSLEEQYDDAPSQAEWENNRKKMSIAELNKTNANIVFDLGKINMAKIAVVDKSDSMEDGYSSYLEYVSGDEAGIGGIFTHFVNEAEMNNQLKNAAIIATQKIHNMGLTDYEISDLGISNDNQNNINTSVDEKFFCTVIFKRAINGTKSPYVYMNAWENNVFADGEAAEFRASWEHEYIRVDVYNNEVYKIYWNNPVEIMETKNVEIIDIEEAKVLFEKNMDYVLSKNNVSNIEINIDSITLGMYYLPVADNFDTYTMTPCWFFFGMDNLTDEEQSEINRFGKAQLIINAIDGSIV